VTVRDSGDKLTQSTSTEDFLREMTELARRHGVGIAGPFDLFDMESVDYDREYRDDGRGKYEFV